MSPHPASAGKTAIVTGASSGIGRAIAETLGAAGAHVYLAGRTRDAMDASRARIEAAGGRGTVVARRARRAAVQALVDRAVRETGRLDVMVNNAGLSYPTPIIDGDPEEWRAMLETNVLALLVGSQAAVRAMRECRRRGPRRQHLVDRGAARRLRRLRRHQARRELHLAARCGASSRRTRSGSST